MAVTFACVTIDRWTGSCDDLQISKAHGTAINATIATKAIQYLCLIGEVLERADSIRNGSKADIRAAETFCCPTR